MIDRFEITEITRKHNLVYIVARNLDDLSQGVCITIDQPRFNACTDRQLSKTILSALNRRYPQTSGGEMSISEIEMESADDIIKSRINNTMSNLRAIFTYDTSNSISKHTVIFADQSHGAPLAWLWDFGDGNTSVNRDVVHTYANAGTYTVTLTVSRNENTHTVSESIVVE